MSRVSELLRKTGEGEVAVYTIEQGRTVREAAQLLRKHNIGALPVMAGNTLVGIISERDLTYRVLAEGVNLDEATVAQYMTFNPEYVSPFTDVMDCLNLMKGMNARHIPVLEKGKLVGIVSLRDVLNVILRDQTLLAEHLGEYFMNPR